MKIFKLMMSCIVLIFLLTGLCTQTAGATELFDFYIIPGSTKNLFPCIMDGQPCEYHNAVPMGKKSILKQGVYIGTGEINLKKVIENEKLAEQFRFTIYRVMTLELDKSLAQGIDLIEKMLAPKDDYCLQGVEFNRFIKKLKTKITIEEASRGETSAVINGRGLIKNLSCDK